VKGWLGYTGQCERQAGSGHLARAGQLKGRLQCQLKAREDEVKGRVFAVGQM
jgi:hypothetical protein